MRVTQGMLIRNNMKYLSQNYNRLTQLNEQMMTGKKISKPSDDPVVAMNGMHYRSQVVEIEQFKRNLNEGFNWLDNADSSLNEAGKVLQRIRDLTVQASNDSYDPTARGNIADEIDSLQQHLVALAETKVGHTYIFSGTDTDQKPIKENQFSIEFSKFTDLAAGADKKGYVISYQGQAFKYASTDGDDDIFTGASGEKITVHHDTNEVTFHYKEKPDYLDGDEVEFNKTLSEHQFVVSHQSAVSNNTEDVVIEVMKGVKIPINVQPQGAFSIDLFSGLESIKKMINDPGAEGRDITQSLDYIDNMLNDLVSTRSELGARTNRIEMVENRLLEQEVIAKETVSENEGIDLEKVLIDLTVQRSIHQASLAVAAKLIQPTLMDYLR